MKLKSILFALIAVSLTGGFTVLWLAPDRLALAPDITVTTLQGKELRISQPQGKPLLVNFWASGCRSCLEEMRHLSQLYRELSPRGLEILGIAMPYDPPNRVVAVSRNQRIPYPIALDIRGEAAEAFGGVRLTPSSFLIAPDGRIIHRSTGELKLQKVRALLAEVLAHSPQPAEEFADQPYL